MRDRSWVAGLALLVAACGGPGPADSPPGGSTIPAAEGPGAAATEPVASAAPSAPAPAKGRTVKEENEMYTFSYAFPDAAAAIPDLRVLFDRRLEEEKADLVSATRSEKADAEKEGFPFRPHAREIEWKVVADVPGWLSLSSTQYGYTGGAHGMTVSDRCCGIEARASHASRRIFSPAPKRCVRRCKSPSAMPSTRNAQSAGASRCVATAGRCSTSASTRPSRR
ncbi:DUF4163 domain-containing protein [Novosphingobium panipatense]|uniref:DUF4163 domain-containing protein n=1 Tax=Novosphingobium panipatense TaxID=428991 RepID=UPI003617F13F